MPSCSKGLQFFRLTWEINLIGFGKKSDTRRKLRKLISPIPTSKNRGRKKGHETSRKLQGKKGGNTWTIPNLKHPFCLKKQHKARTGGNFKCRRKKPRQADISAWIASGCGCGLSKIRVSRNTSSTLYIKPTFYFENSSLLHCICIVRSCLGALHSRKFREVITFTTSTFAYLRIPSHFCDVHGHQAEERARVMRTGLSR